LQVKLCDPCLSALYVPWCEKALYKYSSFPFLSSPKGRTPQFSAHICYGQMAGWIKMPLGMEVGLGPGFCVRWGPHSPSTKRWRSPPRYFSVHVHCICGQSAGYIKTALGTEVGLDPGHIVLGWDPAPLPKKGTEPPPQISAYFYCGQTVGCIKMPRGMEVGLRSGDFALDGDPGLGMRGIPV